ncbi:MAG TPA: hypothetical protein PKI93_05865 [Alphaproteobacteria bacterium]|nr:hypothetical protein [Alphaproteobacteria bacterium]HNS45127.1 hypothetical protein [Alphaproteobacteria bacterium]
MLLFIARWFKGLIVGWIIGLILFMLKRALSRAFGNLEGLEGSQGTPQPRRYPNDGSVVETLWAGMSAAQLTATFGPPDLKNKTGPNSEVWTYSTFNGKPEPTAVTIQNGKVTSWARSESDETHFIPS